MREREREREREGGEIHIGGIRVYELVKYADVQ